MADIEYITNRLTDILEDDFKIKYKEFYRYYEIKVKYHDKISTFEVSKRDIIDVPGLVIAKMVKKIYEKEVD